MVGIYDDSFIELVKKNLGYVKVTSTNIITKCPWCEINQKNKLSHYHLYIDLKVPRFHCFRAKCPKRSGNIKTLLKRITGNISNYNKYVDHNKISFIGNEVKFKNKTNIVIPDQDIFSYISKMNYLKQRLLLTSNDREIIKNIPNLVFDIKSFLYSNNLVSKNIEQYVQYLQNDFIGFLTYMKSMLIMRSINNKRYFKYKFEELTLFDYYQVEGDNNETNNIVLSEGVFDILMEKIHNRLELDNVKLYACCLSSDYFNLIKSICVNNCLPKINLIILSDSNIEISYYKKLAKKCKHVLESFKVYYNLIAEDFGSHKLRKEVRRII